MNRAICFLTNSIGDSFMVRRHTRTFARPAARSMIWLGAGLSSGSVPASSVVLLQVLSAVGLAFRPFTVVRSRLFYHWRSDQQAASEFVQGVTAVQVVTEVAAAGGIGNVPTPLTEPAADYFVYQPLMSELRVIGSSAINMTDGNYTVDSKAMRKVDIDDQIVFTVENRTAVGAELAIEGRLLIKLH